MKNHTIQLSRPMTHTSAKRGYRLPHVSLTQLFLLGLVGFGIALISQASPLWYALFFAPAMYRLVKVLREVLAMDFTFTMGDDIVQEIHDDLWE
ncbi:MAG: hypothetical protein KTR24_01325 [Saprospiraceae bacterium]|nr:hypothetical protein [Saprospiraceae bacterium]